MKRRSPAVFFDKDGTLVHDVPYNVDPGKTVFRDDAFAAMRELSAHGWKLFIISNQAGIAEGRFRPDEFEALIRAIRAVLAKNGIALDGFYYCPHHPCAPVAAYRLACRCRKPGDGMLRRAAREHALDLGRSWMVGDILNDMEAGRRAGCRTILLDVGNETQWRLPPERTPDHRAGTLGDAADLILSRPRP